MASAVGIVLAASTLLAAAAGAAERKPGSAAAPAVEAEAEEPTATVILDGQPLFRVRGISAYPAAQWAQAISERIATIMADRLVAPDAQVVIDEEPRCTSSPAIGWSTCSTNTACRP
jgi:hypothetical protein